MVRKAIVNLNTNKAFGPDEIHSVMLKELVDYICQPLSVIMNKTLKHLYLPEDQKTVQVLPNEQLSKIKKGY